MSSTASAGSPASLRAQQLPLALGAPPRTSRHRPAQPAPEDPAVYLAVLALRGVGRWVYRSDAQHRVDGRLLSSAQLLRLARHVMRGGKP